MMEGGYILYYERNNELYHHGIKGMHWGVRRYQNADGTLTEAGLARAAANSTDDRPLKKELKSYSKQVDRYRKGEELYRQGHRITDYENKKYWLGVVAGGAEALAAKYYQKCESEGKRISNRFSNKELLVAFSAINGAATTLYGMHVWRQSNYMRAYYGGKPKLSEGSKQLMNAEKKKGR